MKKCYRLTNSCLENKGDDSMSTLALDNMSFKDFIAKNKEKVYRLAKENTVYNAEGKATISKDDPWFYEDEWNELNKDGNK